MPFVMIDADQDIMDNVKLVMTPPDPIDKWFGTGEIPLQFPPRIKANSKAMNWKVEDAETYEPIVILQGAKETKLTIELKYVVGAGTDWGVQKISRTVHDIMGYFYRGIRAGQGGDAPLLQIRLYEVAPEVPGKDGGKSTWRINNANLTQTDELIVDNGKIYPQVTTVTLDMSMVTQIGPPEGSKAPPRQAGYRQAPVKPKKEWY